MRVTPGRTVLLLDYSAAERAEYVAVLAADERLSGCKIVDCCSGEDGIAWVRRVQPVCLLLNHTLSDCSGIEFLTVLRQEWGDMPCPVIFLAEAGQQEKGEQALAEGASDYLYKGETAAFNLCYTVWVLLSDRGGQRSREGGYLYWIEDNVASQHEQPDIIVYRASILRETDRVIVLDRYYPIPGLGPKKLLLKSKLPSPVAHDLYQAVMMYLIAAMEKQKELKTYLDRLKACMTKAENRLFLDGFLA